MSRSNNIKEIIDDYCVVDTETTGLSSYYDEIIEVGVLRVRNNEIVEKYSQLIKPENEVGAFITSLTGITNDMLIDMPSILDIKEELLNFIGGDIIIGHNTSFDIRFLNCGLETELDNKYMDTFQFSRKLYPELKHHRLSDMVKYLNLHNNEHRSIADCISTKELYDCIKAHMCDNNIDISDLWKVKNNRLDISSITPDVVEIDEDNFFYNRHVVFTGKLERMIRKDAMQIIVNLGGILDSGVNNKTNYLILGDNDYNAMLKGEKSSKHKKAEKLKLAGNDIDIIDELTFYDLINQ